MHLHEQSMAATRPSDLKVNNRMQILELFKSGAVYSVADLAAEIGISRQTVMKAIQFFLEKGIIVSGGKANSGSMGGKRAELFTLSSQKYLFSVLICPNALYISLFNYRCETLEDYTREDIVSRDVDAIMDDAIAACEMLLRKHRLSRQDVRGVCLATSGIVDRNTDRLRFNSLFPEWGKDVSITEKLSAYFGRDVQVLAENVCRVCGSAYAHSSRSEHCRLAALFSRWGGLGACLIEAGHILHGKDTLIGEIGHMIVNPQDEEVCACGSRGCFERQISVERLRILGKRWAGETPESGLAQTNLDAMTIRDMFRASEAGDPLARRLVRYAAGTFSVALRNLSLVFNPDLVVIQGDYAYADDYFRACLYEQFRDFHYYEERGGDDNPFALQMDTRPIQELTTLGGYTLLIDRLFSDETTYS